MTSTPSPGGSETLPSSPSLTCAQSAKDKRYDRQLRLWGDHGQSALERARVCVINATATATEILKSLILPGVGQFTIVDGEKVSGEDVGNNFFLEHDDIGQNRGIVACRLLLELNPEVRGDCVDDKPDQILQQRPDFFKSFSLVIATNLDEKTAITLSNLLWSSNTPFMLVRSYGLVGYIRLQISEHDVIESHPDNVLEDLRLDRPFQTLVEFMDTQNLEAMSKQDHSHTPYVVILYKFLQVWRSLHQSEMPKNFTEKLAFKDLIRSGILQREDGNGPEDEENFEEALKAANTALVPSRIPSDVLSILSDPKCLNLTSSSPDFWIMARALKDFVEGQGENGLLPVRGSIPDMLSDSKRYIQLQNIYREKAAADAEEVYKRVQHHLEAVGRQPGSISESTVRKFCRESGNLRLIRQSASVADEYTGKLTPQQTELSQLLEQDPDSEATYYLILRAVDRFYTEFSALPGALADQVEPDISHLKNCLSKVIGDYHLSSTSCVKDEYVHEICRYGGAEPHALASLMGGCAAQEAIKILTKQYVPIDNMFLFNMMTMASLNLKIG